jgi:hypothetical protein
MDPEALVKVLDCRRLADRIAPGMSERWRGSSLRDRSIRLEIATGVGGLILQTGPAGVRTSDPGPAIDWRVEVPEIGLTQMMLGARSYAGLLRGRPGSDPELEASISVLFPDRRPWIHLADML